MRIRVNGAYVIRSAESRPRPIRPVTGDRYPPKVTRRDRALVAAVRERHRARDRARRP